MKLSNVMTSGEIGGVSPQQFPASFAFANESKCGQNKPPLLEKPNNAEGNTLIIKGD